MVPIEKRETKFVRKLLKMYNKGATVNECYQYCCEHTSLLRQVDYKQDTSPYSELGPRVRFARDPHYLTVETINHILKLTFTGDN